MTSRCRVCAVVAAVALIVAGVAGVPISPAHATPTVFVVDSALDEPDADPGDGVCATTSGVCTLRAAVQEGKAQGGEFEVQIAPGVDPVVDVTGASGALQSGGFTLTGDGNTITPTGAWWVDQQTVLEGVVYDGLIGVVELASRPVLVARDVTIEQVSVVNSSIAFEDAWIGQLRLDESDATLDATWVEELVELQPTLILTLTGGSSIPGVYVDSSVVEIADSTVRGDLTMNLSDLEMRRSTVEGSLILDSSNPATIESSTLEALSAWSEASVVLSTIAPGGINAPSEVTLAGSVVQRPGGPACEVSGWGEVVSQGWNVVSDDSCGAIAVGDQPDTDALLGPLADNGGPTWTRLPTVGSPAQDAIPVGTELLCDGELPVDQRGVARPQGSACDAGSVEVEAGAVSVPGPPASLSVAPGDGSVSVSWDPPTTDGGAPLEGYTVSVEPGGHVVSLGAEVTETVVGGLVNGTAYVVSVVATNEVGDGDAAVSVPVTPVALPGQPSGVVVVPAVTLVHVAWAEPSDGGPVVGYEVTVQPGGHVVTVDEGVTEVTVGGLETGVDHMVWVAAVNEVGAGDPVEAGPVRTGFPDVAATQQFFSDIAWLVDSGFATGYDDGTFRPTAPVSRQAMVAFLWRVQGEPEPSFDVPPFSDVPASSPFAAAIAWAAEQGVVEGFADGTFRPTAPVSRQASAAFLWRLAGEPSPTTGAPSFVDVPPGSPFFLAVTWMAQREITTGYADGTFRPTAPVSRQAMAAFLHRYHDHLDS